MLSFDDYKPLIAIRNSTQSCYRFRPFQLTNSQKFLIPNSLHIFGCIAKKKTQSHLVYLILGVPESMLCPSATVAKNRVKGSTCCLTCHGFVVFFLAKPKLVAPARRRRRRRCWHLRCADFFWQTRSIAKGRG